MSIPSPVSPIRLICSGCGYEVPADEPYAFRCPRAQPGDDIDHVLERLLEPSALPPVDRLRADFLSAEPNPFLKYRLLLGGYQLARRSGWSQSEYEELVTGLDRAIAQVDGHGFEVTPFEASPALTEELGVRRVWVKDETGNVSGSHKARHLMGLMIHLEIARRLGGAVEASPLAIASCGNAALAAAVVARAAGRELEVFVPEAANRSVVSTLERLGADLKICVREAEITGDPCCHRFRAAVAGGALPFSCQGPDNGLVLEGGQTLVFEMLSTLIAEGAALDRLVVQVGGGALATAAFRAFDEARALGLTASMPRLHAVQSTGASPLARAYDRVVERLLPRVVAPGDLPPDRASRARLVAERVPASAVDEALEFAATHRSSFMWPWEEEPQSVAYGILDDETYDWLAVVRGMLTSGGYPLVAAEETLLLAHRMAREKTAMPVDPTGSAGLAGYLELRESGELGVDEEVAVLFTGVER
ncbi:MAG: pyridoxal-phosphate dependent enzyme [Acidobacteria bacterium]|nr:pyridoxal-phosphate dependent enzyme [Acidobacteriota bacterium]